MLSANVFQTFNGSTLAGHEGLEAGDLSHSKREKYFKCIDQNPLSMCGGQDMTEGLNGVNR